ncbi:MAG: sigma-70 family RNA polymerase sigma factor [Pseudomonadota bacterium]
MTDEDAALVKAFQAGDRAAFDRLVLKHKDRLFNLVYWYLGDYQQANDCAQEIFIKVFKNLKRFRFESAFSTWLYKIAVNTCKNMLQSASHRWEKRTIPLENPEGSKRKNPSLEMPDAGPSPANGLERKERLMLIREAIRALPEKQNQVVVLRDIQGLSYGEISEITGMNLGTIKSRLARGRLELRNRLEGKV